MNVNLINRVSTTDLWRNEDPPSINDKVVIDAMRKKIKTINGCQLRCLAWGNLLRSNRK